MSPFGARVGRATRVVGLSLALSAAMAAAAPTGSALAQPAPPADVEGHVVTVETTDVIVDVAGARGARGGELLELWRPLSLKHPVTGKTVSDRFRIGSLRLVQVRDALATAAPEGPLDRPVAAGDVVILRRSEAPVLPPPEPAPVPPPPEPAPPEGRSQGPVGDEAAELAALFEALRGSVIALRVDAYETWVRGHPKSPYATTLREEAALLRRLYGLEAAEEKLRAPALASFAVPEEALANEPLTLAVEVRGEASVALLHLRHEGETAYGTRRMEALGDGYFSATLSAAEVGEGSLEYFLEAAPAEGPAAPIVGYAAAPLTVELFAPPDGTDGEPRLTRVALWTDYADYNRLRGNDFVWQTEGAVTARYGDTGLRALRTGFGVYRGVGGSLEELDDLGAAGRRVGLTYGYLEGEVGFHEIAGLSARAVLGLRDSGITGGGMLLFRVGSDVGTNLSLGGELLGGVGLRGSVALELAEFEDVPMLIAAEVTNQPAGTSATRDDVRPAGDAAPEEAALARNDVGGRAVFQAGYRILGVCVISARISYQGRTIKHSGPGFGGGVSYTW